MNCIVCNNQTRNIEYNTIYEGGVPIPTSLCLDCVDLMLRHSDCLNEHWSFQARKKKSGNRV